MGSILVQRQLVEWWYVRPSERVDATCQIHGLAKNRVSVNSGARQIGDSVGPSGGSGESQNDVESGRLPIGGRPADAGENLGLFQGRWAAILSLPRPKPSVSSPVLYTSNESVFRLLLATSYKQRRRKPLKILSLEPSDLAIFQGSS